MKVIAVNSFGRQNNDIGASSVSEEVRGTPMSLQGLNVASGTGSITLSWSSAPGASSIYIFCVGPNCPLYPTFVPTNTHVFNGLQSGTTYTGTIRLMNESGILEQSWTADLP